MMPSIQNSRVLRSFMAATLSLATSPRAIRLNIHSEYDAARCALVLHPQETCPDCLVTLGSFDRVIAAFDYDAPASLLIHRLKAQRRFTDVPLLTNLLASVYRIATAKHTRHHGQVVPFISSILSYMLNARSLAR